MITTGFTAQQIQEILKCSMDIKYYAANFVWIPQKEIGEVIPFEARWYQDIMLEWIQNKQNGVAFKSRRIGASTVACIGASWLLIFRPGINILLLSNKEKNAMKLLDRVKFVLNNLRFHDANTLAEATDASFLKPEIISQTKTSLTVGWRDDKGNITNQSVVESLTTTGDSGRSDSAGFVFMDELAFLPNDRDTFAAATPTTTWGGFWMAVSTPNGTDNVFYDLVTDAKLAKDPREELGYNFLQVHWTDAGITDEMIKRSTMGIGDDLRRQEWELEFIQAGSTVFNKLHLDVCYKPVDDYPQIESILKEYEYKVKKLHSHKYYSGVDSALGRNRKYTKGDYHAFTSLTEEGIQAYTFRSNQLPLSDWAGHIVDVSAGTKAIIKGKVSKLHEQFPGVCNIEENQSGHTVINMHELPNDGMSQMDITNTNVKTKSRLINNLILAIEKHQIVITDRATYEELLIYQRGAVPGTFEAPKGRNDDLVMALALAWDALIRHGGSNFELNMDLLIMPEKNVETIHVREYERYAIPTFNEDLSFADFPVDEFDDFTAIPSYHPDHILRDENFLDNLWS